MYGLAKNSWTSKYTYPLTEAKVESFCNQALPHNVDVYAAGKKTGKTKTLSLTDSKLELATAKAVLTNAAGKPFADVAGPSEDSDKGWVNGEQTWKDNTLYIDFWRPTVFTNSLKSSHIPKLDATKQYDYTLSYGVYSTSYAVEPLVGTLPTMVLGTTTTKQGTQKTKTKAAVAAKIGVFTPIQLTVLKGAMWNAGVTAAAAAGLVAVTLY